MRRLSLKMLSSARSPKKVQIIEMSGFLPPALGPVTDSIQVGWIGTTALMMKTQFGLGVLAMPGILDTLGMIPGVICICAVAVITTWSNYIVGAFKLRHPEVYGIDDAGALMFGRVGREVFGVAVCLCEFTLLR